MSQQRKHGVDMWYVSVSNMVEFDIAKFTRQMRDKVVTSNEVSSV